MVESLAGGLVRGAYLVPIVVGLLIAARHGSYLPLWLPQTGLVSAYTAHYLAETARLPLPVAFAGALIAGTVFGLVVHLALFQRCVERAEPYPALLFGLATITLVTSAVGLLTSGYPVSFPRMRGTWGVFVGWPLADTLRFPDVVALVGAIVVPGVVAWLVAGTRIGLEYRAASSNRHLASEYGLRLRLIDLAVPLTSSLLCSFGGLVFALKFGSQPTFMVPLSIKGIAVVVALGTLGGVVVAGFATVLLAVGEAAVQSVPAVSAFEQGLAYAVLVVALLLQYVLGPRTARWIWRRRAREAVA